MFFNRGMLLARPPKIFALEMVGAAILVLFFASLLADEIHDESAAQESRVVVQLEQALATYTTLASWQERTRLIREDFLSACNLRPMPSRPPVRVISHSVREYDGYSVENVALETLPGFYCTGNLYRPLQTSEPCPAILCPHGHFTPHESGTVGGRFREEQQLRCAHFAQMGAIVFSYSMVGWQDSQQTSHLDPLVFRLQTWNSLRAVDYVVGLQNVDPKRVGVTGASGGGTQALLLTLLEPRIAVCAPVVIVGLNSSGCLCEGGVWTYSNFPEVAAMLAPRPQLLITCGDDWTREFPTKGFPFVDHFYGLAGGEGAVKNVHLPDEGHDYGPSKRTAVYEFFAKHLRMKLISEDTSRIQIETPEQMEVFNAKHPLPTQALRGSDSVRQAFEKMVKSQDNLRSTNGPPP